MIKKAFTVIKYFLQALVAYFFFALIRLIPLDYASSTCGWIMEKIGPLSFFNKVAKANLKLVFPEMSKEEHRKIRRGMWNNLGRVLAEYVHLNSYIGRKKSYLTVKNPEALQAFKERDKGSIIVSGHFANWEMANITALNNGISMNLIYRAPNNFFIEPLYRFRQKKYQGELIPKGRYGAKRILQLLRENKNIGMLADQKMNTGISVPFLGHPAMTLTSVGVFALMRDCPVIPARIKRTKGARFELEIYPPLEVIDTGDRDKDILHILTQMNSLFSDWIKEAPEQWLWIHDRWGLKKQGKIKRK